MVCPYHDPSKGSSPTPLGKKGWSGPCWCKASLATVETRAPSPLKQVNWSLLLSQGYPIQIHGFCDASEIAYAGVVYIRMTDTQDNTHVSLVMAKTKVAPIKRQTIPRLELCGAHLLSKLLRHVKEIFNVPMHDTFAWTDSTIVLCWLNGRFKTFVGNRVSFIMDQISPDRWSHVSSSDNPTDCASRGLFLPSC